METSNTQVHCPQCGSTSLTTDKKGFSGKKAVAGALLTGGIGILAGTIGSNKIVITCLNCGKQFKPGEGKTSSIYLGTSGKPGGPKIIWDEEQKKHVINPAYKANVKKVSMPGLIFTIIIIAVIIYLLAK